MPRKFERPANLPEDIPIYHTTPRDADADLLLKIIAMKTNKVAVFPVFKEEMVEYFPNYFGRIFDKTKNYEFKENRLAMNDYFEIKIPNLEDPRNLAIILDDFVEVKNHLDTTTSSKIEHLLRYYTADNLKEFYWIGNYFQYDDLLLAVIARLSSEDPNFCIDRAFAFGYCEKFAAAQKKSWSFQFRSKDSGIRIVKNLLKPDLKFDMNRLKEFNEMNLGLQFCVRVDDYFVPITIDDDNNFQVVKEGRNIHMKREYDDYRSTSYGKREKLSKQLVACDYANERLKDTFGDLFRS